MAQGETEEIYERIRKKFWAPLRLPQMGKDLLKLFIPLEEARVLAELELLSPRKKPSEIAKSTGLDVSFVTSALERTSQMGLVAFFKEEGSYALIPLVPGVVEVFIMGAAKRGEEGLLSMIDQVYDSVYPIIGHEIGASKSPWVRVIPIEKSIDPRSEVIPFERTSNLLSEANRIFVGNCMCRTLLKRCDNPLETCFLLDSGIDVLSHGFCDSLVDQGIFRQIDKDKALEILTQCEKKGLVHMTSNSQEERLFICNCCTCCCGILKSLLELHDPRAFVKSNFAPSIDKGECNKCEACIKICPLNALYHHLGHEPDMSDDEIKVLEERCIGCGLCASHCPRQAITLTRTREDIPPPGFMDMLYEWQAKRVH